MQAHASEAEGKAQGFRRQVAPDVGSPVDISEAEGSSPPLRVTWPKFTWRDQVGKPGSPYLVRWVLDFTAFSIRLHHWIGSDDVRHPHDHAWDFVSVLLCGSMTDRAPGPTGGYIEGEPTSWRDKERRQFVPEFFHAEHRHSAVVGPAGAWTLLLTGHDRREWGFWTPRRGGSDKGTVRFRRRNKYFREHGHH
jgi:hypothetical protein